MDKYYYEEIPREELVNSDSPLKIHIFEFIDKDSSKIVAWCYDEEFAKKVVKGLNNLPKIVVVKNKEGKEETIVQRHSKNFETLTKAFKGGDVAIMDCIEKTTGEHVAVICAVSFDPKTKETNFTPFAKFFNGNPYELLTSPIEYDKIL